MLTSLTKSDWILIAGGVLAVVCFLLFMSVAWSDELDISKTWCQSMNGEAEFRLYDNARVDCLLPQYAVEVEYTTKWYESIGQSLYYAMMTDRKPGILFIRKKGDSVHKARIDRFMKVHKEFKVWWIDGGE